jgi:hypothetical protein
MSRVTTEDRIVYYKMKISDLYSFLNNLEKQEKALKEKQATKDALKLVDSFHTAGIELDNNKLQDIVAILASPSTSNKTVSNAGVDTPISKKIYSTKKKIKLLNVKVKLLKKQAIEEATDRGVAWLKKTLDDANMPYTEKLIDEFRSKLKKSFLKNERIEKTEYEYLEATSQNSNGTKENNRQSPQQQQQNSPKPE